MGEQGEKSFVNCLLTPFRLLPRGALSLRLNFLLDFRLLVELVEVVHDYGDGEGNAEHAANRASCKKRKLKRTLTTNNEKKA